MPLFFRSPSQTGAHDFFSKLSHLLKSRFQRKRKKGVNKQTNRQQIRGACRSVLNSLLTGKKSNNWKKKEEGGVGGLARPAWGEGEGEEEKEREGGHFYCFRALTATS